MMLMNGDEGDEYQRLVRLIEDVEAETQREEVSFVDISETIEQRQESKPLPYGELVDMIEDIEGKKPPVPEKRPAAAAPAPHAVLTGLQQAEFARVPVSPQPQVQAPKGGKAPKAPSIEKEKVAKELGAITKKIGSIKPSISLKIKSSNINVKDLVLPNLSPADQISELERVIEGLREHVFDQEHLDIVTQEVFGLQQVVNAQKKAKKPQQGLEQSLIDLRDQRLADAVSLIQQYNTGAT